MCWSVVVHPRFGDTARVATDQRHRPQLVADIGTAGAVSIQVDDEPGSTELAAGFARSLAVAALGFARRCEESISGPPVALSAMCDEVSADEDCDQCRAIRGSGGNRDEQVIAGG